MAARPSWQGHLRLSLVTCPVALYRGTDPAAGVSFNLIDPETNDRIRMQAVNVHGEPVDRSTLVNFNTDLFPRDEFDLSPPPH